MTELIGNSTRLRILADAGGERVVNQVDDAVSSSSFKSLMVNCCGLLRARPKTVRA